MLRICANSSFLIQFLHLPWFKSVHITEIPVPNSESSQNNLNSTLDPTQDPTSPFYLHPSDNPGIKLVSEKFNGDRKRSMMISLSATNKLGMIDGSIHKTSSGTKELKAWERCNSMLICGTRN